MEMRPGYKQTETGVVPEDWRSESIGEFSICFSGGTPRTSNPRYYGGDIPWITSSDLNRGRIVEVAGRITPVGLENSSAKIIAPGTLLLALYGATAGVCAVSELVAAINQAVLAIIPRSVDTEYLYQYLTSAKDDLIRTYTQGGQPNLSGGIVKSFTVPVPPTEEEQRAIATTLSDVDALLGGLDRLVTKKRALRQAAMQQLLTGETRLPGFHSEWEPLNMARNSLLKARIGWQGLTTAEYLASGTHYLVTGTDFSAGRVNWETCPFVAADRYEQDRNIQLCPHDVLVTKDGTIGKVAFVDELPGPATLNSGVFVIRPRGSAYEARFLFHILASTVFEDFLTKLAAGSTISHLYQKDFVSFAFLAPPTLEEQSAIAEALDDMAAELAALEVRRDKTRDLKRAMMQQLLTGKTRLVLRGPANV
ncbi:MAG TPA: restriction endonuclease subunit S [Microbacteriaceae bacterium]|jgi:type I restriction enzyme S subunit|nr:restriction endonuclease subunit S [Microbacteriaceae bacterium]